jgi:hypothetical protein
VAGEIDSLPDGELILSHFFLKTIIRADFMRNGGQIPTALEK